MAIQAESPPTPCLQSARLLPLAVQQLCRGARLPRFSPTGEVHTERGELQYHAHSQPPAQELHTAGFMLNISLDEYILLEFLSLKVNLFFK